MTTNCIAKNSAAHDVLIVGGGAVGLSLALALRSVNVSVAVVESRYHRESGARTIAVSAGSVDFLHQLHVWNDMAVNASPMVTIAVCDGRRLRPQLEFKSHEVGANAFGYVLFYDHMMTALLHAAQKRGVELITGEVKQVALQKAFGTLILADGSNLTSSLLVGADGRHSFLRRVTGGQSLRRDYQQAALTAIVSHERCHHGAAWELLGRDHILALLPLSDEGTLHRSCVVWSMKKDIAASLRLHEHFVHALNEEAAGIMGAMRLEQMGGWIPLSLTKAHRIVGQRWCLVGDAAQSLHPIAGQGLNLGWRDARALMDHVAHRRSLGLDIGDGVSLRQYEDARRSDRFYVSAATDGLHQWFVRDGMLSARPLLSVGLEMVNHCPPLKRRIMRFAMTGHF